MLKVMSQILGLLLRNQLDCTKNVSGSVANIARLSFIIKQIVWLAKMKCKGPRNTYFKFYLTKNLRNISDSITVCNYNLAFHQAVVNSHLVVNELQIFESESNSQIFVTGNWKCLYINMFKLYLRIQLMLESLPEWWIVLLWFLISSGFN